MLKIEFLPASNGDAIFINCDNTQHILIDGGFAQTYEDSLKERLKKLNETSRKLDLVVITHVDSDHIRGVLKIFSDNYNSLIKKVWFNSGSILSSYFQDTKNNNDKIDIIPKLTDFQIVSIKEGIKLEDILSKSHLANETPIKALDIVNLENLTFKVLSPNSENLKKLNDKWNDILKEELSKKPFYEIAARSNDYNQKIEDLVLNEFAPDKAVQNGSSIAFILEYQDFKFLFLADAFVETIITSLKHYGYSKTNPLKVEFVKLSHHGSKNNTNEELLELIDTDTYIISTNGNSHNHPNQEALSRIIMHRIQKNKKTKFLFNYKIDQIFQLYEFEISADDKYEVHYNKEYKFYLYFPKNFKDGAVLEF